MVIEQMVVILEYVMKAKLFKSKIQKKGVTHLKAPVKRKKYSVSKKKRFSQENDAAARMGHPLARRSSRHLISPCGSRSYLFPTLHGSLRFFSLKIITIEPSTSFPVP